MEVGGVSPGRDEHDNESVRFLAFLVALPHPLLDLASVWRVAEDPATAPVLRQAVVLLRVVVRALVVGHRRTRIQIKMELRIQD